MQVNFVPVCAAFDETVHDVQSPCGFLSAKCALAARLVLVEL
jgi:hypothetical protein